MIIADLGQQLESYFTQLVESGRYGSKSEVFREGVRFIQGCEMHSLRPTLRSFAALMTRTAAGRSRLRKFSTDWKRNTGRSRSGRGDRRSDEES
jgi:putative addiction module CopG family antidote